MARKILMRMGNVEECADHRSHDTLDNRRCNIRAANRDGNASNHRKHKDNTSGFKGVFKTSRGWSARIKRHGKVTRIGCFSDPRDAHNAYMKTALAIQGEFSHPG